MKAEPRNVNSLNAIAWILHSHRLVRRRAPTYIFLAVAYAFTCLCFSSSIILTQLVTMPLVCIGCLVSYCADVSCTFRSALLNTTKPSILRVLSAGIITSVYALVCISLLLIIFILIIYTLSIHASGLPDNSSDFSLLSDYGNTSAIPTLSNDVSLHLVGPVIVCVALTGSLIWFIAPLISITGLSFKKAYYLSIKAVRINESILFVWALVYSSLYAVYLFPPLIIPWFSYYCALMYVSYSDIWLGRFKAKSKDKAINYPQRYSHPIPIRVALHEKKKQIRSFYHDYKLACEQDRNSQYLEKSER